MAKPQRETPPDDVQTAYQVHTLAQLLYARLMSAPWTSIVRAPFSPVVH